MTRQLAFRLACAGQALVVLVGCGVAVARDTGHGSGSTSGAGSNKARAREEAARLVVLTRVPDGARSTDRRPHNLSGPIMGTPSVDSLVIRTAYWRVGMSYDDTLTWLKAHPPHGLMSSGSAQSGGPDGSTAGYGYSDRPSSSWSSADLEVAVAPDGDGSVIRADAVVVWLDPTPMRDQASGTRARVTVAGGCPHDDRGIVGVRNDGQDLTTRLLPDAAPSRGLICRFDGGNGNPFSLRKATPLDGAQATSLADAVRALPLSHTDGGVTSCPMDDGAAAIVALVFPGTDDVDLWVTLNGCSFVANGHIVAASGQVPELVRRYG